MVRATDVQISFIDTVSLCHYKIFHAAVKYF